MSPELKVYNESLRKAAADQQVPMLDVYAIWEQMDQVGIDIHSRLSNGINHPDVPFHYQLSKELKFKLFE